MGIKDLLRFMRPFIETVHIKKYSGKRVGIDAYSWLHKGAYSCSMELCLDSSKNSNLPYLQYFMHRINLLRHHGVTPVVVFDGGSIPCKSATEDERQRKRDVNLALAQKKLSEGDVSTAVEFFQRAVCITPAMAYQLIQILRSEGVEFVVAPYEADAQLAYLSNLDTERGGISAVITEDSDLMAYGCRVIIFKMDRYGNGEEVVMDNVFKCVAGESSFTKFDQELFTGMCVLAGCDFLPSVPGIGIKRAYTMVSKYRNLDRVLSIIKFEKARQVPEDYSKSFREAVAVFHHAKIFDADEKILKPMKPLSEKLLQTLGGDLDFLGPEIPSSRAIAIAEGRLDPITMEAFDNFSPTQARKIQIISRQHTRFTIISPHQTKEEESIAVTEQSVAIESEKFSNEALALGKLISEQNQVCPKLEPVEAKIDFPDNNPFKKKRKAEGDEEQVMEPISIGTDVGKFDGYREFERVEEKRSFPDNNPFKKKRKAENGILGIEERPTEEVSVVTDAGELEDCGNGTTESQESVESKPAKRGGIGNEKRLRRGKNCKHSEGTSSTSSILKFFTRL